MCDEPGDAPVAAEDAERAVASAGKRARRADDGQQRAVEVLAARNGQRRLAQRLQPVVVVVVSKGDAAPPLPGGRSLSPRIGGAG